MKKYFFAIAVILLSASAFSQYRISDIKIDTTITGFKFASNFQGTYVYTANGAADLNTMNPSAFSFSIYPNATYRTAMEQLNGLQEMSKFNGYTISDLTKKDTVINGYKTYIVEFTETLKGSAFKNLAFHAFYLKDRTGVLFVSGDFQGGKHIENFRKTFYASIENK
jgi:hypothetical protein